MTAKDLFSRQAADYARFRPSYPAALFDYLATLPARKEVVWDVGTGSGQAAVELAERFDRVIGTDLSDKQLEHAATHPKIEYRVGTAEAVDLPPASVDLVTVAQAFHWFDHAKFFERVRNVCRPEGAFLAVWSYALSQVTPSVDEVVRHYYSDILGPYWEPQRALVEEGYKSIAFPFPEETPPPFNLEVSWQASHFFGYLSSWSATQTATEKLGRNVVEDIAHALAKAWGPGPRKVTWPLSLRVARVTPG